MTSTTEFASCLVPFDPVPRAGFSAARREEEFRRVIAEGEPFLLRLQERSDRAELHYLLGLAYADIVGLADGISECVGHGPAAPGGAAATVPPFFLHRRLTASWQ